MQISHRFHVCKLNKINDVADKNFMLPFLINVEPSCFDLVKYIYNAVFRLSKNMLLYSNDTKLAINYSVTLCALLEQNML